MIDIERRRMAAYWFAVGHHAAAGDPDLSDEFAQFAQQQATAYYTGETHYLGSVPHQWEQFQKERVSA